MKSFNNYNLLLLKILDSSTINNDYRLERFYAKTSDPAFVFTALKELRAENLIITVDPNAQVRTYHVTEKGKLLLKENYSREKIKPFVAEIEDAGFFLKILNIIEEKENQSF